MGRKSVKKVLLIALAMLSALATVSCAEKKITSPEDAIIDAYGDRKFKISFDSTELDEPISDMFYTAKNMPTLPTPRKIGFVFAGWYFDQSFTQPCDVQSGDLLWKMKNVTLYPKWEEEKIVNKGTYEIEYNAKIVEGTVAKGILADKYGYREFPNDIIESETYIEKNDKGTFLRIQYDNVVRGPVLGGPNSDPETNFSKMTYTITDKDNRINKEFSIQDRTNNIQTIYYDISDLPLTTPINLFVEYFNLDAKLSDLDRPKASVKYQVEFTITKFIGFDQTFVNPEGRLENGVYVVPTHYTSLNKTIGMLDMFNPVYAYIEAKDGKYKLVKPLNAYNNDKTTLEPSDYQLRDTGYAREFACMHIDNNKVIESSIESNSDGKYYLPELIGDSKYLPITYEFHVDTGRYYYSIDLGDKLDKDLVFIGGSAGAMEQMFSFGFDYRRLTIDYQRMVRIVDWDYKPLDGEGYSYNDKVAFYPGATSDFSDNNIDFDIYRDYRQAIEMTNVFFSKTSSGNKMYDTKVTISLDSRFGYTPSHMRNIYGIFDMQMTAYGYDPKTDGDLFGRDLTFITNTNDRNSNSAINKKLNGKTFNIGDKISLNDIFLEKVCPNDRMKYTYQAYELDVNLNIKYDKKLKLSQKFTFDKNIAIEYKFDDNVGLVHLVEKEKPSVSIDGWSKSEDGIYITDSRFNINDYVKIPEIKYNSYGNEYSLRKLNKDDGLGYFSDYTKLSVWEYNHGIYKALPMFLAQNTDFKMQSEKVRVMAQLVNPFGDFETIILEFRGIESGEYEIILNNEVLTSGDLKYKGSKRLPIKYEITSIFNINNANDILNIPTEYTIKYIKEKEIQNKNIGLTNIMAYTKNAHYTFDSTEGLWDAIKNEDYVIVIFNYLDSETGDAIVLKGEYNFRVDGRPIEDYLFIDTDKTVFNNKSFTVRNPLLMSNSYKGLTTGDLKVLYKTGDNFIEADPNQIHIYNSDKYSATFAFNKFGTYLLCWNYILTIDQKGNHIFEINNGNDYSTLITFNICQEVVVEDIYADVELRYATDKLHPFDKDKIQSLLDKGYEYSYDDKYEYLTVMVSKDSTEKALTQNLFVNPNEDLLYAWMVDEGLNKIAIHPDYSVRRLGSELENIHPTIYALWDSGIDVNVSINIDGKTTLLGTKNFKHRGYNNIAYTFNVEELYMGILYELPLYYDIYGWEASRAIFIETITDENGSKLIHTNFKKHEAQLSIDVMEGFDITAIVKKKTNVKFSAVDEYNQKLEFNDKINNVYGVYISDKLSEIVSRTEYENLKNPQVTNKKFVSWQAYDKEQNKWVDINIDTFILEDKYTDNYSYINIRAVFK